MKENGGQEHLEIGSDENPVPIVKFFPDINTKKKINVFKYTRI